MESKYGRQPRGTAYQSRRNYVSRAPSGDPIDPSRVTCD